jgi:hypothetical protein
VRDYDETYTPDSYNSSSDDSWVASHNKLPGRAAIAFLDRTNGGSKPFKLLGEADLVEEIYGVASRDESFLMGG